MILHRLLEWKTIWSFNCESRQKSKKGGLITEREEVCVFFFKSSEMSTK